MSGLTRSDHDTIRFCAERWGWSAARIAECYGVTSREIESVLLPAAGGPQRPRGAAGQTKAGSDPRHSGAGRNAPGHVYGKPADAAVHDAAAPVPDAAAVLWRAPIQRGPDGRASRLVRYRDAARIEGARTEREAADDE